MPREVWRTGEARAEGVGRAAARGTQPKKETTGIHARRDIPGTVESQASGQRLAIARRVTFA